MSRAQRRIYEAEHGSLGERLASLDFAFSRGGARRRRHLTAEDLVRIHGPECCWCRAVTFLHVRPDHPLRSTVEHLLPRSRGGRNDLPNLRVACFSCNNKRGDSLGPPGDEG